ncbi:MAG: OmpA family protein [candidate division Zixibacteria bacterium]|nr:OmpA family protein [candidate division Zixibacteria bacterium]
MKHVLIAMMVLTLALVGCTSKDFVRQEVEQAEARMKTEMAGVRDATDTNAAEITKLQSLSKQISEKADLAIDKAKGFENYQIIWQGEINFEFDAFQVTAAAEQILMEAGEKMEQNPGSIIEIAGHTDRTGAAKYNIMLGEQRAGAAKRFLADRFGLSLYRMFVISYGEQKPVAMPDEREASSKNRRVSLAVWGELK